MGRRDAKERKIKVILREGRDTKKTERTERARIKERERERERERENLNHFTIQKPGGQILLVNM